jgi:probable F420-dependent oxidoreductase
MDIGIAVPHFGPYASPKTIVQVAQEAERLGFASVWVLERMLRPIAPVMLFGSLRPMQTPYAIAYDPIETLTYVAAHTDHIKLGTSVLAALFHVPAMLAKRLATLDQFSGGRVIAGLGQGTINAEFDAAKIPLKRRGAGFEEFVAALRAAWGPDPVSFSGRFYHIPESEIGPKPVQPGGPPILFGGRSPASVQRAARITDGLNPVAVAWEPLEQTVNTFREAAEAAGRDPRSLLMVSRVNVVQTGPNPPILSGSVAEQRADLARFHDLGIDHIFADLNFVPTPIDDMLAFMRRLREAAA